MNTYTPCPAATKQSAKLMEMRAHLLHAAATAYAKDPCREKLAQIDKALELTRAIVHDEISGQVGAKWCQKLHS